MSRKIKIRVDRKIDSLDDLLEDIFWKKSVGKLRGRHVEVAKDLLLWINEESPPTSKRVDFCRKHDLGVGQFYTLLNKLKDVGLIRKENMCWHMSDEFRSRLESRLLVLDKLEVYSEVYRKKGKK